ncbi:DUF3419 family protein [Pelagibacterium halotolerans]|uniref:DUF3419 family protein n=1 Tax=Pelagibacterium halotolerans TaxID=531813 RepID=UPI00384F62D4
MSQDISSRARFDHVRYAQVWEDADVLMAGLRIRPGESVLSIGSAGDNALALLTADPGSVVALDLSKPQIMCILLRVAAYRTLTYSELLELMGSRSSTRRGALLDRVLKASGVDERCAQFWDSQREAVVAYGVGGVGKFERYFRIFREKVLPLVHSGTTVDALLCDRPHADRARFHDARWNNWRWRLMLKAFFSRAVMGRLGRDPAFFTHAEGSLPDQVAARTRHALVELEPHRNPYLHWILKGHHGAALPLALREEHFVTIRARLDRLEIAQSTLESFAGRRFDAFNLSDLFEYLDPAGFEALYGALLDMANPGARLVYWNMMAPRSAPVKFEDRITRETALAKRLHVSDKAFFYSNLVVERVR